VRTLLLLLVVAVAAAAPATLAAQPPHDSVTGAGEVSFTDFPSPGITTVEQDIVAAFSGPNGEVPHGTLILHSVFGDQRAEVTCLHVVGNTAVVGGLIVSGGTYLGLPVTHLELTVQDNGEGTGAPDTATGYIFINRPPGFDPCTPVLGFPAVYDVVRGNFVVNDAD
jgi:hypothetical protein